MRVPLSSILMKTCPSWSSAFPNLTVKYLQDPSLLLVTQSRTTCPKVRFILVSQFCGSWCAECRFSSCTPSLFAIAVCNIFFGYLFFLPVLIFLSTVQLVFLYLYCFEIPSLYLYPVSLNKSSFNGFRSSLLTTHIDIR
jgi:hypothetical protein